MTPDEVQAAWALVETPMPHYDWCCANGCAGPGFCDGGCDDVCRCVVAEFEPLRTLVPQLLDALEQAQVEAKELGELIGTYDQIACEEQARTQRAEAAVVEARKAALREVAGLYHDAREGSYAAEAALDALLQQEHQAALNAEVLDRKAAYAQIVRLQEKVALSRQEIRALKDRLAAQVGTLECGLCGAVLADPDSCPDCDAYGADLAERLEKRSRQFPSLQGEYRLRRSQGAGAVDEGP